MVEVSWKAAESIHWGERELMLGQLFDTFAFVSKGAGVFERPGQTMDNLSVFGTSRTSNGLKIEP